MRPMIAALMAASILASPAFAAESKPVPASALVKQVNIPHQSFTLKNGLRVIVHTDRKAPVVAVSIWYDVGSKHEPKGKTGFAHLFEHLMFNGSENAPGDFFEPLQQMGATDYNGTTWFDRTNYFQTVPKAALDRILYLESDRMGHLLGAVTQENLTNQIGVVQNEKREGDNEPYGLVEYAQLKALLPEEHPYGHSTIGSMADLDAASMDDVRDWFRQHYGPNNAVLVLAGDIDVKTAKSMAEKYFGKIARGPQQKPLKIDIPALSAPKSEVMKDRVAATRVYRYWTIPGIDNADSAPLDVAAAVLGGLASSRLDNALVRNEKLAVNVVANAQSFAQLSFFEVRATVRPGVDPATLEKRLDEIVADFIKSGPTIDEVKRVQMSNVANRISGLEQVGGFGGKAVALAEGALYRNDSNFYKKQLQALARVTPAQVKSVSAKWLSRPAYALKVIPGERDAYAEPKGTSTPKTATPVTPVKREPAPSAGAVSDLTFPAIERAKLSNGIEVVYARRTSVPVTQLQIAFDAGQVADPRERPGTQSLMLSLLEEGAAGKTSTQIAEEQERLGANVSASASLDQTTASIWSLSANLAPSLALFSEILLKPDFAPTEVERLKNQKLAQIDAEFKQPQAIANRYLPPLLFGAQHPYGISFTGTGDKESVAKLTRDDLIAFHRAWIRPDKARIVVVSDRPLAEIKTALEARFGSWRAEGAPGTKPAEGAPVASKPRIVLIDRPDSPQSLIFAGQVLPVKGSYDLDAATVANEALGASFLSRINMNLRENKGWSYGVRGYMNRGLGDVAYLISAPVQADRTGDAISELSSEYKAFLTVKGLTEAEYSRLIENNVRELPGSFETAGALLGGIQRNLLLNRPDNYYALLASKYRSFSRSALDTSLRSLVKPDQFLWLVIGDAKKVRPQLEKLGLPLEQMALPPGN